LSRCGAAHTLARKGTLVQTPPGVVMTPLIDEQLMGAEISSGSTVLGHVEGLVRDPLTHRVRGLITSYGLTARRVAVPMEWVTRRSASRLKLGVAVRSLDDLGDRVRP
jgi:hypothetical protein